MATAPNLLATSYDGSLTVGAQWQPIPTVSQFVITVYSGGTVVASGPAIGSAGTVKLAQPLTSRTCQVAVATNDGGPGPESNRLLIVVDLVTGLTAGYDGSRVSGSWVLPARPVNAAQLTVTDAGGRVLAQDTIAGTSGALTPSAPLASGASLQARAAIGTSTGPPVTLPLVTTRAAIRAVAYDPADGLRVQVVLASPAPTGATPSATLLADGAAVGSATGTGTVVTIPLSAALDPATAWSVRPAWSAGTATGPAGPPVDLLTTAPTLGELRLDDVLALSWRSLPGPPYPTGGQLLLSASGQPTSAAVISGADGGRCTPAPPLTAGVVYAATVAPLRGPAEGPASAPVSVANVRTAIASTDYDGRTLTVTWAGSDPAGTTGARVEVLEGTTVIASRAATGGTATLDVALEPGAAHGVRLRWTTAGGVGPAGPAAAVLTTAGSVDSVAVDATGVSVRVAPPAATPGVARYVAQLFRDGRWLASSEPVAAGPAPAPRIVYAAAGLTGISVRVQALAAAGTPTGSGPLGPAAAVLTGGPTVDRAIVSGRTLELQWTPAPGPAAAIGTTTVVVAPTSGSTPAKTFAGLPGRSAVLTFDAGYLDPSVGWTATATSVGPVGASPASPAATLLVGGPTVAFASWDGERLRTSWTWPEGAAGAATATAYRLELFAAGTRRGHVVVDAQAGTIVPDGPIDPSARIALAVSPLAPPAAFVATPALSVPWTAPELQTVATTLDGHAALAFAPPTAAADTITGYTAVLSAPGQADAIVALAGTSSPQTIALPGNAGGPFAPLRVALRATGPQVLGPASDALPILRSAPALREVAFADGVLALEWTPVPEAIDGYEVRVTGGADPIDVAVPGATARVPLVPGGDSWRATVVACSGRARGPAAPGPDGAAGLPLLLAAPTVGARTYDAGSLAVAVTAPAAPAPPLTGYRLELLRDGVVVRTAELAVPAAGRPLLLAVDPDHDLTVRHAVRVRGRCGASLGPPAGDAPVVLAVPSVTRARVATTVTASVAAGGLAAAGLTLQAVLIADGSAGTPVDVGPDGQVSFPLPASTVTVAAIAVRAGYAGVTGPWSTPTPLPLVAPVVHAARYEDGTLLVAWDGEADADYRLAVVAGGADVARATAHGAAASLRFDPPTGPAQLAVQRLAGVALGPTTPIDLVTAGPAATATTGSDGSSATLGWTLPSGAPVATAIVPVLATEGQRRELPGVAPSPATTTVPLAGVPSGAAVGARVQAGVALGPVANLAPIVVGRPSAVSLVWAAGELSASWRPPEDPQVDGSLVTLSVPDRPDTVAQVAGASSWRAPLAAGVRGATVTVAATAGSGTGAAATAVPVIVDAPALTLVAWDGAVLSATWTPVTAPASVAGYLLTVGDGTAIVAQQTVSTPSATLGLTPADGPLQVTVTAFAPGSTGPTSAPVAVPRAAPASVRTTVDPATGTTTVSWPAVTDPAAPSYLAQVYRDGVPDGAPLAASGPTTTLAVEPTANQAVAVAIAVRAVAAGLALAGPYGPRQTLPTAAPSVADVDFDGGAARVRWAPVPEATGYAISIVGGEPKAVVATADAGAGATTLRLPVTLPDPSQAYEVVVQARFGPSTGVRTRAPLFVPGLVVQAGSGPSRTVRATTAAAVASAVTAYLPPIGTLTGLPLAPAQAGAADAPFTIAANPDPATVARFPYTLTIAGGALRFDGARSALAATYATLLAGAESAGATPPGIFAIQQAIARLMPQSFDETLYYAYGLSASAGCVDLRPGTILRVAASSFDLTAVSAAPAWSSGYAPGPVIDFPIGDYRDPGSDGAWLVGFDAFAAWLTTNGVLTVPAPQAATGGAPAAAGVVESGGSAAADLFFFAFRQPYQRLLVPDDLQPATPPAVSRTSQQFAIAAAGSWAAIDAATPVPGGGVSVAYLRGRAVLSLCIRVEVDGSEQIVPVGTTVGNLLDGLGRRPPATAGPLSGLRLDRALGPVVLDPTASYDAGATERVHLDWNGLVTWGGGRDALSLPLLHGDRLRIGDRA